MLHFPDACLCYFVLMQCKVRRFSNNLKDHLLVGLLEKMQHFGDVWGLLSLTELSYLLKFTMCIMVAHKDLLPYNLHDCIKDMVYEDSQLLKGKFTFGRCVLGFQRKCFAGDWSNWQLYSRKFKPMTS
eukprot:c15169_g2_i1 orf=388-771(+)